MKKVAVVIPIYKNFITKDESTSIKHLNKFLSKYDKYLVLPNSIRETSFKISKSKKIFFPDEYFGSIKKYCELMNSRIFYREFLNYEYILIYQLDALIFSDELYKWCNKKYDYIGAPFFNSLIGSLSYKKGSPLSGGNGGLSLRKIQSFLEVIEIAETLSKRTSQNLLMRKLWFLKAVLSNHSHKIWLDAPPHDYPFNEDGFWSFEAVKYKPNFRVAPFKEALKFSFERFPKKCFKLNNNTLPFGCHAWARYDREFWSKYLVD